MSLIRHPRLALIPLCALAPMVLVVAFAHGDDATATASLDKVLAKHVKSYLRLADKWKKRDPDLAERALRRVLDIVPKHEGATGRLRKMGRLGTRTVLFDGSDLNSFHFADPPHWRLEGRELRGIVEKEAYSIRSLEKFKSDHYVIEMEGRLLKEYPSGASLFTIGGEADEKEERVEFGILRGEPFMEQKSGAAGRESATMKSSTSMRPKFDPRKWNTYRLAFEGRYVVATINHQEVGRMSRDGFKKGGYINVICQCCDFAVRRLHVTVIE